jgi:hypothetical protein
MADCAESINLALQLARRVFFVDDWPPATVVPDADDAVPCCLRVARYVQTLRMLLFLALSMQLKGRGAQHKLFSCKL